jgi:hypothetical protein
MGFYSSVDFCSSHVRRRCANAHLTLPKIKKQVLGGFTQQRWFFQGVEKIRASTQLLPT